MGEGRAKEVQFPPVELADPETGLLCVGGDLSVPTLLSAYRSGVFPWPLSAGEELYWFAPAERAILNFSKFHVPRSLKKEMQRWDYRVIHNDAFSEIISGCAEARNGKRKSTWITPRLKKAYEGLFEKGYVQSVGISVNDELVGGIYGVRIGAFFAGESMFHKRPNASKIALVELILRLSEQGCSWLDCQQMTPVLSQFGAELIPRERFMQLLAKSL